MEKYVIAIDLDDTLLNDESMITSFTKNYLTTLLEAGHKIILATGRPYRGMYYYYEQLNLSTPLIADNGASVFNPTNADFPVLFQTIPVDVVKKLFKEVRLIISSGLYSVKNNSYVYNRSLRLDILLHLNESSQLIEGPFDEICDLPPHGIIFIVNAKKSKEFESIVAKYPLLTTRNWGMDAKNAIYEVYIKSVDKATGLKHILNYYQLPVENLIAFGDGINDFEMLDLAHYGVAMINGNDSLKAKAKYITKYSNNEDGVVKFLETIIK